MPPRRQSGILGDAELEAERGLVQMLEKKYQVASQENDAAKIKCDKALFEAKNTKRELVEL